MDKKSLSQDSTRSAVSKKTEKTQKTRPFHLSLDTDHNGMIQCHIDGWMHIDEATVLWNSIQTYTNCLELGAHKGLSTWILAQANPYGNITTIEIFDSLIGQAKNNCKNFNNIKFVCEDSNTWLSKCKQKFEWVFVDHSHETEYMDKTIECLKNCVTDDHLILLHDMHLPGVKSQESKFATFTRIRNLGIGTFW